MSGPPGRCPGLFYDAPLGRKIVNGIGFQAALKNPWMNRTTNSLRDLLAFLVHEPIQRSAGDALQAGDDGLGVELGSVGVGVGALVGEEFFHGGLVHGVVGLGDDFREVDVGRAFCLCAGLDPFAPAFPVVLELAVGAEF